jgi:hypothetical protein
MRDAGNWFALLERTHQVQYAPMWASFVALRMSERYSISRHVFPASAVLPKQPHYWDMLKFNHILNFGTECLVLYIAPKDKIQWRYTGGREGATTLVLCVRLQCEETPSCWKRTLSYVQSAGMQTSQLYRDNTRMYCSQPSLERRRV